MSYIIKKFLAVIISVLIAVMMISFTGCNGEAGDTGKNQGEAVSETAVPESGDSSEDGGTNDTDDSDDSDFDDSFSSDSGTGDKTEATLAPDKQDEVIVESDGSSPKTPGPTGKPSPKPETKPSVTATPRPTEVPGGDYKIEVTGPASLEKGKTVEYTLKITECTYKKGFIGLDFCLDYNSDLLDFQSSETVKVPAKTWEVIHREDNNEKLTYFCIEDNDVIEDCIAVTGPDQFEVKLKFKVVGTSSDDKCIIKLYDVMGTKNNDNLDVAYGSGNSINIK